MVFRQTRTTWSLNSPPIAADELSRRLRRQKLTKTARASPAGTPLVRIQFMFSHIWASRVTSSPVYCERHWTTETSDASAVFPRRGFSVLTTFWGCSVDHDILDLNFASDRGDV